MISLPLWHVGVFPHFLTTTLVPWQRSPPYFGFGLTQSLLLVCKPSIDLVQKLHSLHSLQPPLTSIDKTKLNKILPIFLFPTFRMNHKNHHFTILKELHVIEKIAMKITTL